jgi:hypothetical protein
MGQEQVCTEVSLFNGYGDGPLDIEYLSFFNCILIYILIIVSIELNSIIFRSFKSVSFPFPQPRVDQGTVILL